MYDNEKENMNGVDLHSHTRNSDGMWTPEFLVKRALEKNISALAITDHNHITEYRSDNEKIIVIPGCEFNAQYTFQKTNRTKEIHIIGLFICHSDAIDDIIKVNKEPTSRTKYLKAIIKKLNGLGYDIDFDDFEKMFPNASYSRAHLAVYMEKKSIVKSATDAFDKLFGNYIEGLPAYVDPIQFSSYKSMKKVVNAIMSIPGGIPVLCHPLYYNLSDEELIELIQEFGSLTRGNAAVEIYYGKYNSEQKTKLNELRKTYGNGIIASAGSDCHGREEQDLIAYPREILDQIIMMRNRMLGQ